MYERSAIVLENYFTKILGFNKPNNLKTNYQEYTQMIEEIKRIPKNNTRRRKNNPKI